MATNTSSTCFVLVLELLCKERLDFYSTVVRYAVFIGFSAL